MKENEEIDWIHAESSTNENERLYFDLSPVKKSMNCSFDYHSGWNFILDSMAILRIQISAYPRTSIDRMSMKSLDKKNRTERAKSTL